MPPGVARAAGSTRGDLGCQRFALGCASLREFPGAMNVARLAFPISADQFLDHVPVDIRESVVAALEAVGELFVVEAELVEDGGL